MSQARTQLLGQDYWGGICGFVSVIHGMLLFRGGDALNGLSRAELEYNLGMSMQAFLRHIRSKPDIAQEIVDFTRTFGGVHANKTLDQLIGELDFRVKELAQPGATGVASRGEDDWGIAMTKRALVEYIEWLGLSCVERSGITDFSQATLRGLRNCVVGIGNRSTLGNGFGGLRHWVYVNEDGVLYNWGTETPMADKAVRPYEKYADRHNIVVAVLELRR